MPSEVKGPCGLECSRACVGGMARRVGAFGKTEERVGVPGRSNTMKKGGMCVKANPEFHIAVRSMVIK